MLKVRLPAKQAYSYPIFIAKNLLINWQSWLPQQCKTKQIVIITDEVVNLLYAKKFYTQLNDAGYKVLLLTIASGEKSKSHKVKQHLELEMLKNHYDRHTVCIALGGGVVGDITGFVAATYMRGIKYIQFPTTLLAMVDSSIGGKVAINTQYGKNLIGAFWQPQAVIMDISLLNSLPQKHLINGLVEIIKIFLTSQAQGFTYLQDNLTKILLKDARKLHWLIKRAVKLKAMVIKADEKEANLRMILNFGHTLGHALEKVSQYKLLHGYAVALGIVLESKISVLLGHLAESKFQLILTIMHKLGITLTALLPFNLDEVIAATFADKKNKDGKIHCILLADIGLVHVTNGLVATPISPKLIRLAFTQLTANLSER